MDCHTSQRGVCATAYENFFVSGRFRMCVLPNASLLRIPPLLLLQAPHWPGHRGRVRTVTCHISFLCIFSRNLHTGYSRITASGRPKLYMSHVCVLYPIFLPLCGVGPYSLVFFLLWIFDMLRADSRNSIYFREISFQPCNISRSNQAILGRCKIIFRVFFCTKGQNKCCRIAEF